MAGTLVIMKKSILISTAVASLIIANKAPAQTVSYHVEDAGWRDHGIEAYNIVVDNETEGSVLYTINVVQVSGKHSIWSDWRLDAGGEDSKSVLGNPIAVTVTWRRGQ
jgi:hypothetical protein